MIRVKRILDQRETSDGVRVLVTRYWPRGVRKEHFDCWMRELAPSAETAQVVQVRQD